MLHRRVLYWMLLLFSKRPKIWRCDCGQTPLALMFICLHGWIDIWEKDWLVALHGIGWLVKKLHAKEFCLIVRLGGSLILYSTIPS